MILRKYSQHMNAVSSSQSYQYLIVCSMFTNWMTYTEASKCKFLRFLGFAHRQPWDTTSGGEIKGLCFGQLLNDLDVWSFREAMWSG